jgi:hypothetical protein
MLAKRPAFELAQHTGCLMNKLTPENRGAGNQIPIKSIFSTCYVSRSGGFFNGAVCVDGDQ